MPVWALNVVFESQFFEFYPLANDTHCECFQRLMLSWMRILSKYIWCLKLESHSANIWFSINSEFNKLVWNVSWYESSWRRSYLMLLPWRTNKISKNLTGDIEFMNEWISHFIWFNRKIPSVSPTVSKINCT